VDDKLDRLVESVQQVVLTMESLKLSIQRLLETAADQEHRLRVLEHWRSSLMPVIAVLTFILGSLFDAAIRQLG
jgi:hypothetical protein